MTTDILKGKKGLLVGIANEHSIAWGCARAFHEAGAELAITYLNEKAEPYVRPLAESVKAPIIVPLDVTNDEEMKGLFELIGNQWGRLDFLLHAIAFAPKGRILFKHHELLRDHGDESLAAGRSALRHRGIRCGISVPPRPMVRSLL